MSGTFQLGDESLQLLANTMMVRLFFILEYLYSLEPKASIRIELVSPTLGAFTGFLDQSTKDKITSAAPYGELLMQATISPSEILFLIGLQGHIRVSERFSIQYSSPHVLNQLT